MNSPLPAFLKGDLWSGIAAVRIGERRLVELVRKYGVATFQTAIRHFMDYGEQVSLKALEGLPRGRFELAEEQDDGSVFKVAMEITNTTFVVDLTENPDQVRGPTNASRDGVIICAQMAFKAFSSAAGSANAGSFRPLRVITRPGSVTIRRSRRRSASISRSRCESWI